MRSEAALWPPQQEAVPRRLRGGWRPQLQSWGSRWSPHRPRTSDRFLQNHLRVSAARGFPGPLKRDAPNPDPLCPVTGGALLLCVGSGVSSRVPLSLLCLAC